MRACSAVIIRAGVGWCVSCAFIPPSVIRSTGQRFPSDNHACCYGDTFQHDGFDRSLSLPGDVNSHHWAHQLHINTDWTSESFELPQLSPTDATRRCSDYLQVLFWSGLFFLSMDFYTTKAASCSYIMSGVELYFHGKPIWCSLLKIETWIQVFARHRWSAALVSQHEASV